MIKVLFTGMHTNAHCEDYFEVYPFTSSVTLIQTEGKNILVDVGFGSAKDQLLNALADEGLTPESIDAVFLTHRHLDHCYNLHLFPNATVYNFHSLTEPGELKFRWYKKLDSLPYPACIRFLHTPGHTADHCAVVYKEEGKTYVMAGDAFREDTVRELADSVEVPDKKTYIKSLKAIFDCADVIVPGHGRVVEGELKDELSTLIDEYYSSFL